MEVPVSYIFIHQLSLGGHIAQGSHDQEKTDLFSGLGKSQENLIFG